MTPGIAVAQGMPARTQAEKSADLFVQEFQWADYYEQPKVLPLVWLKNQDDRAVNLASLAGRMVVLNIWATWCPPCLTELPSLVKLHKAAPEWGWEVVTVSVDRKMNGAKLHSFLGKRGWLTPYSWYDSNGGLQDFISTDALPVTYILDTAGQIRFKLVGRADWMSAGAQDFLKVVRSRIIGDNGKSPSTGKI